MSEIPEFLDQDPAFDNDPMGTDPMPWHQVWIAAITKPNEQTFRDLAAQSNAKPSTAYLWVFLSYMVTFFIILIAQIGIGFPSMANRFSEFGMGDFPVADMGGSLVGMLCIAPFGAGLAVLVFMIVTAIIQWVSKLFGGTGSYDKLVYPFAAIQAPLMLVSGVLSALTMIPIVGMCLGIFSMGIFVYRIVLQVLAVKAVNDLDTGKAVGAVLLPGLAVFLFFCCCVLLVLVLVGPEIGNVFSEIQQGIY